MQELCNEPFLHLCLDPDQRILCAQWKGYQSFDNGVAGCHRILDEATRHGISRILNDNTLVRGLWMDAAEWAGRIWFPRLRQAGVKHFAWVCSPARFSRISMSAALAVIDDTELDLRVFQTVEEASVWLHSVSDASPQ